jgi:predicted nucleic acid-binding protein
MRLVIDASTVGSFILPDEATHLNEAVEAVLLDAQLIQPIHWPIELAGLVLKASRRNRLPITARASARDKIALLISAADIEPRHAAVAAFDLAVEYHISVYDAAYLELAQRLDLPLMTRDGPLADAVLRAGLKRIDPR